MARADEERGRGRASARFARRLPARALGLAAVLVLSAAAASAAATLLALRGAVIPAPRATPPEQSPAAGSGRLAGFSVADTRRGEPRWTMRLATSRTGLLCSTVGQLVGGEFGIVGLDRRFRRLSPDAADACSIVANGRRVARRGADLRRRASGRRAHDRLGRRRRAPARGDASSPPDAARPSRVHAGGTFLAVLAGSAGGPRDPGPAALRRRPRRAPPVRRRRARAARSRRRPGVARQSGVVSGDRASASRCDPLASAATARQPRRLRTARRQPSSPRGAFFAVRRMTPGSGGGRRCRRSARAPGATRRRGCSCGGAPAWTSRRSPSAGLAGRAGPGRSSARTAPSRTCSARACAPVRSS